jgi:hypothetical protein
MYSVINGLNNVVTGLSSVLADYNFIHGLNNIIQGGITTTFGINNFIKGTNLNSFGSNNIITTGVYNVPDKTSAIGSFNTLLGARNNSLGSGLGYLGATGSVTFVGTHVVPYINLDAGLIGIDRSDTDYSSSSVLNNIVGEICNNVGTANFIFQGLSNTLGNFLNTTKANETTIGVGNYSGADTLFSIGNGGVTTTTQSDGSTVYKVTQSNLMEIKSDGTPVFNAIPKIKLTTKTADPLFKYAVDNRMLGFAKSSTYYLGTFTTETEAYNLAATYNVVTSSATRLEYKLTNGTTNLIHQIIYKDSSNSFAYQYLKFNGRSGKEFIRKIIINDTAKTVTVPSWSTPGPTLNYNNTTNTLSITDTVGTNTVNSITLPSASTTTAGVVKLNTSGALNNTNGLAVNVDNSTTYINNSNVLSVKYNTTASALGVNGNGLKINTGVGIYISPDNNLSIYPGNGLSTYNDTTKNIKGLQVNVDDVFTYVNTANQLSLKIDNTNPALTLGNNGLKVKTSNSGAILSDGNGLAVNPGKNIYIIDNQISCYAGYGLSSYINDSQRGLQVNDGEGIYISSDNKLSIYAGDGLSTYNNTSANLKGLKVDYYTIGNYILKCKDYSSNGKLLNIVSEMQTLYSPHTVANSKIVSTLDAIVYGFTADNIKIKPYLYYLPGETANKYRIYYGDAVGTYYGIQTEDNTTMDIRSAYFAFDNNFYCLSPNTLTSTKVDYFILKNV